LELEACSLLKFRPQPEVEFSFTTRGCATLEPVGRAFKLIAVNRTSSRVIVVFIPQLTTPDPRSIDDMQVANLLESAMDQGSVLVATWNTLPFPQHNQKLSHKSNSNMRIMEYLEYSPLDLIYPT